MLRNAFFLLFIAFVSGACQQADKKISNNAPLSYWNNTEIKTSIIEFVNKVCDDNSASYVRPQNRIAVFDNDGTLWCEKPLYIPVELEIAYIKEEYPNKQEWKNDSVYTSIYNNDLSILKRLDTFTLMQKLFAAHDGQNEEAYKRFVYEALSNIHHKQLNRPLKELSYSPMVQLVHYLQHNDFKVFIVTGGEITSVRTVSEEIYNIPKENVIGSSVVYKYIQDESGCHLIRQAKIASANDKYVKPTNIELHIGQKPIFAAGNSNGDYEMMEYTLSGDGPSMAILVHHDDEEREYSYMHGTEKAINDAPQKGWHIVSMKKDFKKIFSN